MAIMTPDEILRRKNQGQVSPAPTVEQTQVPEPEPINTGPATQEQIQAADFVSEQIPDTDVFEPEETDIPEQEISPPEKPSKRQVQKPAQKSKPKTRTKTTSKKVEQIRDLPSAVMNVIRQDFPQGMSKADAITAYVFVHSGASELGSEIQLSAAAQEAIKHYEGDNTLMILDKRLAHLERLAEKQTKIIQTLELALAYITCDRTFGVRTTQISPQQANFRETAVLDVLARLREQAEEQRAVDNVKNGRPIR